MAKSRVTEDEFNQIKKALRLGLSFRRSTHERLAARFKRSLPTIMRVHTAKDHEAYLKLVRAEHPPQRRTTLHERFNSAMALFLHKELITQEEHDKVTKGHRYEHDTD